MSLKAFVRFGVAAGAIIVCIAVPLRLRAQSDPQELPAQQADNLNYRIGPGDLIDVVVTKNDTLSRNGLRVSNMGTVQLPMVDKDVPAACMTERQLAERIADEYKKYLVSPSVNVAVREFNSNPVAVIGAVNTPGRFQMQRPVRVAELLTLVNGPSANAGSTIDIIRDRSRPYCEGSTLIVPKPADEEFLSLNLADTFKGGDLTNPFVRAGDIVRVAAANVKNAYIQGNVRSSLAISLQEPVTLTQAIAMSGGTTPGAQIDRVMIRRQMAGSMNRDAIVVNIKDINRGKRDDVLLQPNDIIDVPGPSGSRKLLSDIFNAIVPTVTRIR